MFVGAGQASLPISNTLGLSDTTISGVYRKWSQKKKSGSCVDGNNFSMSEENGFKVIERATAGECLIG